MDSSNGLINVPIHYDGGTGFDALHLVQTGGATQTSDTYSVGPNSGEGTSVITGPSGTQTVYFQNLTPVLDAVPATTQTVNATPSDNAINYAQGPGGGIFVGNTGLVTIDNQESLEFNNKTNLVLNALAGSDEINLNDPTTPAGLTGTITVNGGDPTASDTLVVNGTTGGDTIGYNPSATLGSGFVTVNALPVVNFTTIEAVVIDGQGGTDALTSTTPAGGHILTYTQGAAPDAGTIATARHGRARPWSR